jgi:hypothetical protein
VSLFFMWTGVAILYTGIGLILAIPFLMGECLPRDLPGTAACDAAKRRDLAIYVLAFLTAPAGAAAISRRKSARLGMAFLLAASILPFILVIGTNAVLGP